MPQKRIATDSGAGDASIVAFVQPPTSTPLFRSISRVKLRSSIHHPHASNRHNSPTHADPRQEPGFLRDLRLGFALLPSDPSHVRTSDTLNKPPLRHTFTYKNADFGYPRCWPRSDVCYGEPPGMYANEHGKEER